MKPRNYIAKHARMNRAAVFKQKKRAAQKVRGQKHKQKHAEDC